MNKFLTFAAVALLATACDRPQPPSMSSARAPAPVAEKAVEYKVVNMSPKTTPAATPFNVQVDHGSGISFELNHPAPAGDLQVLFDGKPLGAVVANGVIVTATIPDAYIAKAGRFPVSMQLAGSPALAAGDFIVE